ncbi:MAG: hypothetical protein WC069_05865 [Candidatus Shapirobacteria bacterium]
MLKSNFEFEVIVNGHSAKEYLHKASYYIEGKQGSKFSLRMRNNSGTRVLFVPTVDGLSVMSGKEASFESRGYIVNAYSSVTVDGWRTSNDNVAEFFFSSPKGSYAVKSKKGGNLGVIGCAVFKEKQSQPLSWRMTTSKSDFPITLGGSAGNSGTGNIPPQIYSLSSASLNCSSQAPSFKAELGAGFGKDKYSPVVAVDFDKESSPEEVFSIFYNTRKNLEEMGVEFRKPVYVTPSAFPHEEGYCKRPRN